MKKLFTIFCFFICILISNSLLARVVSIPLIGQKAPPFEAKTTKGVIKFPRDYQGKWVILFSFPSVFTPICTAEMIEFAQKTREFKALNCEVVGISTNNMENHNLWVTSIERQMRGQPIHFPVISDVHKKIAKRYGMIHPDSSNHKMIRSVFFIDPTSKVRAIFYYPISNGRNYKEITRLLIAMQTADRDNVVTPPDWKEGDRAIKCPACSRCSCERRR